MNFVDDFLTAFTHYVVTDQHIHKPVELNLQSTVPSITITLLSTTSSWLYSVNEFIAT